MSQSSPTRTFIGGLSGRDFLFALIFPTVMAAGFVASKPVLDVLPPILLSALRHTIAAAILIWFFPPPRGFMWRLFLITFIAATVHFSLIYAGIGKLDVATAVILVQSEVPFAIIIAAMIRKRMPSGMQMVGTFLGVVGTVIVFGTPSLEGRYVAAFMLILGSLAWAVGQNMVATLKEIGPFRIAAWLAVFATIQLWPLSILVEGNPLPALTAMDRYDMLNMLIVGIGPTIIGYGLWCSLIARHGIVPLAPFLLTIPIIAVGLGVWLLGERLTWPMVLGGVITLLGVALTMRQPRPREIKQIIGAKDA